MSRDTRKDPPTTTIPPRSAEKKGKVVFWGGGRMGGNSGVGYARLFVDVSDGERGFTLSFIFHISGVFTKIDAFTHRGPKPRRSPRVAAPR